MTVKRVIIPDGHVLFHSRFEPGDEVTVAGQRGSVLAVSFSHDHVFYDVQFRGHARFGIDATDVGPAARLRCVS